MLASLALGADGEYYNVNADEMAAACAAACHADYADFPHRCARREGCGGQRDSVAEHEAGARSGGGFGDQRRHVAQAGACTQALKQGVGRVRILPAAEADVLPQFYLTKLSCGTEVTCA